MSDNQPLPTGSQLTALDPVFREHPHQYLDRLRAEDPVHHDAEFGRLFLTRFEDVRTVVSNRSLSVDPRKAQPDSYFRRILATNEPLETFEPSMLQLDDPDLIGCARRSSWSVAGRRRNWLNWMALRPGVVQDQAPAPRDGQIRTSVGCTGALHDVECRDRTQLQVSEIF